MAIQFRMLPRGILKAVNNFKKRQSALQVSQKRKMFKQAAVVTLNWIDKNFKAEGGLHEDKQLKWKPLKPVTIALRRKNTDTILQDTGRLKSGWDIHVQGAGASVRSRVGYSSLHEKGGTSAFRGKTVKIPQRKILPTERQALKIVSPVVERYLKKNGF